MVLVMPLVCMVIEDGCNVCVCMLKCCTATMFFMAHIVIFLNGCC